jgi:hypothetical protein
MAAVPMVVSPSLDGVASDLPSVPVARSVKSAESSPRGRVGSGRAAQQSMFGD